MINFLTIENCNIKQAASNIHWCDHCPCVSSGVIPLH